MSIHFKGKKDELKIKVTAEMPQDGNAIMKVPFYCTYKVPTVDQAREIIAAAKDREITDDEVVNDWLIGWSKLLDENSKEIEFNDENLKAAMNIGPYNAAIVGGFTRILFGREAVRRKN